MSQMGSEHCYKMLYIYKPLLVGIYIYNPYNYRYHICIIYVYVL